MAENEKMDSLSRMFNTLIRTPLSEVESVIRKGNLEQQPVAPVEELADTYTKMAAENEPMTFTENIDKPQVNQEFLADAPSFMELLPKEERIDESKFQQKVVLDTDGVYRLKTLPIEENVKTNVDILKEQIGVEQGLLDDTIADKVPTDPVPVEDFGGVIEAMESAKQRELDDTIADKVPTESEVKNMKQAEKMIQDIEREKQKSEEEQPEAEEKAEDKKQPKGFTFDDTFTNYFKGAEGYLKEYDLAYEYKQKIKGKSAEEIAQIKKTYDIGHGHKLTDEEFKTGIVYGIKVRDDDGNKIGLTDEQANFILKKDIEAKAKDTVRDYKNVTGKNFLDLDKNLQNVLVDYAFNGVPIRDTKGLKKALKDNNVFNIIKNLTDRTTYSAEVKGNVYLGTRNKRLWNNYLDEYAKNNLSEELYEKAKKLVLETHQGPTPTTKRKMAQLR